MRYTEEIIEEVRSRNDIVDVVGSYVHLTKRGAYYFGLCPFHHEKSPSFSVSPSRQSFHCFGCGEGGSVFTFLMKYDSLTFGEAVKTLAERAGVQLPDEQDTPETRRNRDHRDQLLAVNKEAAVYYFRQLRSENGERGAAYFRERALTEDTMHRFGLGFAPSGGGLCKHLREKGWSDALLIEAGLAVHDEQRGLRDKFWNRVMFPIQDARGRVIGFGGRVMGDGKPKYLNSPETPVFDKSRNLFGLNLAKNARKGYFILCEGYMDVIALHQAGFSMAVASLGTAFTDGQARLIARYVELVILSYDSDEAGTKAALRGIGILREAGLKGKVLDLRPYKDPDEFIRAEGAEALERRISEAENPLLFEIRVQADRTDMSDPDARTEFYRSVARRLADIREAVERDSYLAVIASRYSVPEQDLRGLVTQAAAENGIVRPVQRPRSGLHRTMGTQENREDRSARSQRAIATWLTEEPALFPVIREWISPEDFSDGMYRSLAQALWRGMTGDPPWNSSSVAVLLDGYQEEDAHRQASAFFNESLPEVEGTGARRQALKDLLREILADAYERRAEAASGRTDQAEAFRLSIEGKKRLEQLNQTALSIS